MKFIEAIKQVRESSSKRKFNQTFDLTVNLKEINLKNPEEKVDLFITLPNGRGKKKKICALVGDTLYTDAQKIFDKAILNTEFPKLTPKDVKKIAREFDQFVAQADIMPQVAKTFGKALGVRGKMPNPKSGAIVPPKIDLQPIYDKLQKTVRLQTRGELIVKTAVGSEVLSDEEVETNLNTVHNAIVHALPQEANNIKSVVLKLTMGKPVVVSK